MELTFILYIFAAFIIIPGTFFALSLFNKFLAAGIATIGMLVIFIFFGIQFFTSDGKYVEQTKPTKWPPTINYCPDYLSLLKLSSGAYVCVDTIGVVHNGSGTRLQKFDPNSNVTGNNTPNASQQFNLFLSDSNDTTRREKIIEECKKHDLTFEGIYDGTKSYENVIPRI
jgi:hypothetical protein